MQFETSVKPIKDQIWVVGGYGQVGQMICTQLGKLFPGKVWGCGYTHEPCGRVQQVYRWCCATASTGCNKTCGAIHVTACEAGHHVCGSERYPFC